MNKKFTLKDCKQLLSDLKLEKLPMEFIVSGIRHCIKNDIHHVDIIMTKVYRILSDKYGDEPKSIKNEIYKSIKTITDEDKLSKLGYIGNLTNRKLFMILLERYNF